MPSIFIGVILHSSIWHSICVVVLERQVLTRPDEGTVQESAIH